MSFLATTGIAATTLADRCDGPGWWPLIPLFWLTAFIVFFVLAARFGWWGRRRGPYDDRFYRDGSREGKARLAERFAAGEIDEQEYRSRLAVLDETATRREGGDRR
jgi:putative membrane protein